MATKFASGSLSPLSATTTLSPPSPIAKDFPVAVAETGLNNPRIQASQVIELVAARASSAVYVFDLAEYIGIGNTSSNWLKTHGDPPRLIRMQTRAGSGSGLIGRLSQGSGGDTCGGNIITAYTTPMGLSKMSHSLSRLPPPTSTNRLVIQVPAVTPIVDTHTLSPSLAPLTTILSMPIENISVLLSATPQESVDLADISYSISDSHVIHLFDHYSSSRESGHLIVPPVPQSRMQNLSQAMKTAGYRFFDYEGDAKAKAVIIMLNGPLALAAKSVAARVTGLGLIIVRVVRPWDGAAFKDCLPRSAEHVHVLEEVANKSTEGALYADVFSTLLESSIRPLVHSSLVTPHQVNQFCTHPPSFSEFLYTFARRPSRDAPSFEPQNAKKLLLFRTPQSALSPLPQMIIDMYFRNQAIESRLLTAIDMVSKSGGVAADRILLSRRGRDAHIPLPFLLPLSESSAGESDFLAVLNSDLLKTHKILAFAKPNSVVLLVTPWTGAELVSNIPPSELLLAVDRHLRIFIIDAQAMATKLVGAEGPTHAATQNVLAHLAFVRLYLGDKATEQLVHDTTIHALGDSLQGIDLSKINTRAWSGLQEIDLMSFLSKQNSVIHSKQEQSPPLKSFEFNTIGPEEEEKSAVKESKPSLWHDAAKHLLFPSIFTPPNDFESIHEEFAPNPALRPEVTDRTYLVTCTVNRRLTPLDYDRNVFHLEFDTSGTGLKYEIGEALGVHGWNDDQEVHDFCSWYGINPDRLVTIPVKAGGDILHTRTVFQALQQQVDLFGKPPKSFYSNLAEYATFSVDKHALQFIGSPEGSATFKKLSEKDTITFMEVLMRYESAHPSIETLCELIGDIKPRHYSIASAQAVVGNRVDLLVVTVDWLTPSGSPRYGQCTRYLAGLRVGQKVTVSIKPSVMKLPPDDKQPIIMAGLGTGAAPFRAFLQYRAWLAQQGKVVGPIYYYFGSRHQYQEYLYGEEIEAYILDGTIKRAGLAFSRDGPKKVYIQHKMLEDAEALADMLQDENGVFYLCGPTWPVPDVYDALVGALTRFKGHTADSAGEFLESLKEEERYVLEVY